MNWLPLVFAAVALQLVAIHVVVPIAGSQLLGPSLLATHALLIPFLVANWRLWGIRVVAVGLMLNLTVMAANGGLMPVSLSTVEQVGRHDVASLQYREHVPRTKNVLLDPADARLSALSDAILIDAPRPLRKAVSVGDVFIFGGVSLALTQIVVFGGTRMRPIAVGGRS